MQMFIAAAELSMPSGTLVKEVQAETETHTVTQKLN